jgi:uncharacterized protein involved in exopolysaccharide biosynthesis
MSMTDEDRAWFALQINGLGSQFGGLGSQFDGLKSQIDAVEARLDAKIERVETNLLTEFHKWASPMELRQKSHSAAIRALDIEHEALNERVEKLERPSAH